MGKRKTTWPQGPLRFYVVEIQEAQSADIQTVALFVLGIVMSAMAWFAKRQIARIDHLEEHTIKKSEYNGTIEEFRNRIDKNAESTNRRLDEILLHLAKSNEHK